MNHVSFHQPHFNDQDKAAALAVLDSGFMTMGAEVFAFEAALATQLNRRHAIMVNACTNGHMLVFQYLRRVIGLPARTRALFPATTFAGPAFQAHHAGYEVRLLDTDPETGATPCAALAAEARETDLICPMPYAGIALHGMADLLAQAKAQGSFVIEDCAHSIGARGAEGALVGSLPTFASIFSFYPTKVLNAVEGGMILTDDDDLADWCRAARLHGVDKPVAGRYQSGKSDWGYALPIMGYKCNPNNLQGAIGLSQLARLTDTLERLQEISQIYRAACADAGLTPIAGQGEGNQHLFVLQGLNRPHFIAHMAAAKIQCSVHYPPLWKMDAWGDHHFDGLSGAEAFGAGCVSLPIYTSLTAEEIARVVAALHSYRPG